MIADAAAFVNPPPRGKDGFCMKDKIRIGYIGLGRRGYGVLKHCFSDMPDVEIKTICDGRPDAFERVLALLAEKGLPKPACTTDYHDILADPAIDAVVVMTGWNTHIPIAVDALKAGKYTAIEVGCAYDISECYALLDAYEQTHAPLMMLENCCYGRREMMALRMAKEGLFGEIIHCGGGYHHFLPREELFKKNADGTVDVNHYRLSEYANRNAEQYPTHELGPISKILTINRGNRFMTLSSVASKARGLAAYMKDNVPADHPLAGTDFKQGDIVNTVLTCANGETVCLTLDTTLPRPFYSRNFTVRGTKGMCEESADRYCTYYFEGMEEGVFGNEADMFAKYDHPLHREYVEKGSRGGHGGMDWLVMRAFVESVKNGVDTPIDVYDTLTWLAIAPLSEQSIAQGGAPVAFPDFTKGQWFRREPAPHGKYALDAIVEDPDTPIF